MILIRAGFARVSQKFGNGHRTLNYLGAGQFYGLEEIAHNWRKPEEPVPLQHTLRVIGYTHVMIIPTAIMEKIVLPTVPKDKLPPLITPVETMEAAPISAEECRGEDRRGHAGISDREPFLQRHGVDGHRPGSLHALRRLRARLRGGARQQPALSAPRPDQRRIMVANACMHCADPVCMIGCPTGAIHRDAFGGQVVINPATCIGCKACFNNCPYDAIRMVEIRDENGEFLVADEMKPIIKATKCDLCVEQHGRSCLPARVSARRAGAPEPE